VARPSRPLRAPKSLPAPESLPRLTHGYGLRTHRWSRDRVSFLFLCPHGCRAGGASSLGPSRFPPKVIFYVKTRQRLERLTGLRVWLTSVASRHLLGWRFRG
jgi:hypothetical protein